jgi:3-(3-hydroxy-phenyl)propionate hydroxylase
MQHAVVIAGAGPTGLMLAGELGLAGVDVAMVEPRASQELVGARAGGLHARTIEVLDQRGIGDRFLSQGQIHKAVHLFAALDITDFPTRHNYTLGLFQNHFERILAGWVAAFRVPIYRERAVTGFAQDDDGVDVELSDGPSIRAQYLVGCDGGRSLVRKTAGIEFRGWDATTSWLIAEALMAEEPEWGFKSDARGTHAIGKGEEGRVRLVLAEPELGPDNEPTLRDVSDALIAVYGKDFGIHSPSAISRFTDMTRQAARYRVGRVLLAGDAAHVHPPMGGQGLNIGVQDAVNLGWKLAQVVKGTSPASLLDTYHAERHPIAARVLRNTMAQSALRRPDGHTKALGEYVTELLKMDEPRRRVVGEVSGLDIRYDLGDGHPLLGHRIPDLELVTGECRLRLYELLHHGGPVLVNFGERGAVDITPWDDRVQVIDANYGGAWELPVIGAVAAPSAVLIRPDGYVAWVGEGSQAGLADALTTWFGEGREPHASLRVLTKEAAPTW